MTVEEEKKYLRKVFLEKRKNLGIEQRRKFSKNICERILALEEVKNTEFFGAYASDGLEVDLSFFIERMLKDGKSIALPRFAPQNHDFYEMVEIKDLKNSLTTGKWNIPEPEASLKALCPENVKKMLWLVPGVAFDRTGMRLGRGKGIYDRLLNNITTVKIGAAYECQFNEKALPCSHFDRKLDIIVSEAKVYRF